MLRAASVVALAAASLAGKHDAVRRRLSQTPDLRRLQSPDTYARTADGQYCTGHLAPLTTEATCRAAGEALGLTWSNTWYGPNDHGYCKFANDGRNKLYFNTAGTLCSDTPTSDYQSVCLQGQTPDGCALYIAGPVTAASGNQVATVEALQNYELTFTMELASDWRIDGYSWTGAVLHIGDGANRHPLVSFHKNQNGLHVVEAPPIQNGGWGVEYTTGVEFIAGGSYSVKIVVESSQMVVYVDGVVVGTASGSTSNGATTSATVPSPRDTSGSRRIRSATTGSASSTSASPCSAPGPCSFGPCLASA